MTNMLKQTLKKLLIPSFFLLVAVYFVFLQWAPVFPDPDSFYHTKMAMLMGERGIITSFPWLKFTSFTQNFTDHHFLYHLFLIPFVKFLPPLIGMKIATTLLAWLSILSFYLFLKKFATRYTLVFTLILLSVAPFVFRMNLAKTSSLSLIILLIALNFIWRKKYLALFFISFLYVWMYGGWSILLFLIACQAFSHFIIQTQGDKKLTIPMRLKSIDWKLIVSSILGCSAGLIINPYFPHNLYFYWEQVVQIGLVNYQNQISVGMEWYPMAPLQLFANLVFILIFFMFGLLALVSKIRQTSRHAANPDLNNPFKNFFALFIFTSILGVMTLKSQRFIEYFAPFFVLTDAFLINFSLPKEFSFKKFILQGFGNRIWYKIMLAVPVALFIIFFTLNIIRVQAELTNRFSWNYLGGAAEWLKNNTPDKSLIFHSTWSDSTILFFNNDHNVYVAGLDPTFFYRYDPQLYEKWTQIKEARVGKNLPTILKNDFDADYILVKNDEKNLLDIIKNNPEFILRYEDKDAKVYQIK